MSKVGWCGDTAGGDFGPCDPPDEDSSACPKCGADREWIKCYMIDCEEGTYDLYEEDPIFYSPGQRAGCNECNGQGGWLVCPVCERSAEQHGAEHD